MAVTTSGGVNTPPPQVRALSWRAVHFRNHWLAARPISWHLPSSASPSTLRSLLLWVASHPAVHCSFHNLLALISRVIKGWCCRWILMGKPYIILLNIPQIGAKKRSRFWSSLFVGQRKVSLCTLPSGSFLPLSPTHSCVAKYIFLRVFLEEPWR